MVFRFVAQPAVVSALTLLTIAVASPAVAAETVYDRAGKWTIAAFSTERGFAFCSAVIGNGRADLRIATDGKIWQVGVPFRGKGKKVEAYYGFGMAAEVGNFDTAGDGVAVMRIGADQVKAFGSSPSFDVSIGGADYTWGLDGGAAAIAKTRDCVRDRGLKAVGGLPQTSAAVLPSATGKNCPAPGKYRSPKTNRPVEVTFFNGGTKIPVSFYWIDFDGRWKPYKTVAPQSHFVQKTYGGHLWVATDPKGNCHPEVFKADPSGNPENNNFQVWFD